MKMSRNLEVVLALLLCLVTGAEADARSAVKGRTLSTVEQAEALLALSDRQNLDNHTLALETARQSLALWQAAGDNAGIARAYAQIGRYYTAQSDLTEASQNYEQALQLWRGLNNSLEEAETLIQLGFIAVRQGEWQSSMSFFMQAQSLIDEKSSPLLMGKISNGLGHIFNESGSPEKGLVQFQRALDYFRQTPDTRDDRMSILLIGISHHLLGNYPEALAHLQQALADVEPDGLFAALCDQYLGKVYISTGEYGAALEHLQSALVIYTRAVNPKEAAQVRGLIGQIYQQQGQLPRAEQYYKQALETFLALSDRVNQAAVYYMLGRLELTRENYDAAEDYLQHSIKATENIRRVSMSSDLAAAFSASVHERYESYIECLMRKHQAKPAARLDVLAFETSELGRARSLAELLRATQTSFAPGLDPQLAEREKLLRQSLRTKEDYKVELLGKKYRKEDLATVDAELARLEAEYKLVNETIRERYPSYEQIARPVGWNLRQIQQQVIADDQTVLLEYSLSAERSYVWAVTRSSIRSYEIPAQALINETAQKLYRLLATPPDAATAEKVNREAQELSRMVLLPVAAELNRQRIIVVADGALNYIPFQLLPAPSGNHELLVDASEIINAPSATILGQLQQETTQRRTPAKMLAAFGDPVFAANDGGLNETNTLARMAATEPVETEPRQSAVRGIAMKGDSFNSSVIETLFYARQELANLRCAAIKGGSFVAADYDATRERLQSTNLTEFAILHFATHGFLDPVHPENSGLRLSNVNREGKLLEGFVGLQDIYNLHAPVDLVVLSACSTALGKEVRGEGLIGLTRGFMYAGASSVVASLWKVDDEATAELMKHFYTNMLQKGMPVAAALRAAQKSIRQQEQWRSPYYWAAFTLQGNYSQVIKSTPAVAAPISLKTVAGVALLLLLLAVMARWYRHQRTLRRSALRAESYSTVK